MNSYFDTTVLWDGDPVPEVMIMHTLTEQDATTQISRLRPLFAKDVELVVSKVTHSEARITIPIITNNKDNDV
jgi:hypothetical protein